LEPRGAATLLGLSLFVVWMITNRRDSAPCERVPCEVRVIEGKDQCSDNGSWRSAVRNRPTTLGHIQFELPNVDLKGPTSFCAHGACSGVSEFDNTFPFTASSGRLTFTSVGDSTVMATVGTTPIPEPGSLYAFGNRPAKPDRFHSSSLELVHP